MTDTRVNLPRMFLSATEVATVLGISRAQVFNLMDQGALDSRYIGRRRLVVAASVMAFIDNLPATRSS